MGGGSFSIRCPLLRFDRGNPLLATPCVLFLPVNNQRSCPNLCNTYTTVTQCAKAFTLLCTNSQCCSVWHIIYTNVLYSLHTRAHRYIYVSYPKTVSFTTTESIQQILRPSRACGIHNSVSLCSFFFVFLLCCMLLIAQITRWNYETNKWYTLTTTYWPNQFTGSTRNRMSVGVCCLYCSLFVCLFFFLLLYILILDGIQMCVVCADAFYY